MVGILVGLLFSLFPEPVRGAFSVKGLLMSSIAAVPPTLENPVLAEEGEEDVRENEEKIVEKVQHTTYDISKSNPEDHPSFAPKKQRWKEEKPEPKPEASTFKQKVKVLLQSKVYIFVFVGYTLKSSGLSVAGYWIP